MAKVEYQIINVRTSTGSLPDGGKYDNKNIHCYCSDSPAKKFLICGDDTCDLKCRADDFAYIMRSRSYKDSDLPGKLINPVFDRTGHVEDFTLSDPQTGEVL